MNASRGKGRVEGQAGYVLVMKYLNITDLDFKPKYRIRCSAG